MSSAATMKAVVQRRYGGPGHLRLADIPVPEPAAVQTPVFAAFGGGDTNVPVEESVRRFEASQRGLLIRVYPDGGHAISDPATGRVQQAFFDDLFAFVASEGARLAPD